MYYGSMPQNKVFIFQYTIKFFYRVIVCEFAIYEEILEY